MWTIYYVTALAAIAVSLPTDDWKKEERSILTKLHQGCFKDGSPLDLPFLVRSSATENSVTSCIQTCREHGFRFAGLHNAVNCYCGSNAVRLYDESHDCSKACPADSSYTCGGSTSTDVYHVSSNDLYLGCYNESFVQRDLPFFQWDASSGKSAEDCVHTCSVANFRYAGVQQGGACYCGDDYGRHGEADETSCDVRCAGWGKQNCGGDAANAIYRTELVGTLTGNADSQSTRLWDNTGLVTGIPTTIFTLYPLLTTILTPRLIIHSGSRIMAPMEDSACANNCYKDCGEIDNEDDLTTGGSDVILRFFYIKLSEISEYVTKDTRRVFVYAQTVVVDKSVDFDFSLLIRTKQIFIDRSKAMQINVAAGRPAFDIDLEEEHFDDIEPNLMQQKMAFTCAKILYDTQESSNKGLAYSVLTDIAYTRSDDIEVKAFATSVRGHLGSLTGVLRSDVKYVPFLTKSRLAEILETYYDEINIYRKNYDEIKKVRDNTAAFLGYAEDMADTYATTDVAEAKATYDSSMTAVYQANETYHRFYWYYNNSRDILDDLQEVFEDGLQDYLAWEIARATIKFITGIGSIVTGSITFDEDDVSGSMSPIIDDVTGLFDTAYNLAESVKQIDELSLMSEKLIADLETMDDTQSYLMYLDDVESTVELHVNIIKWRNLANYGEAVLSDPQILRIRGATNYYRQLMDVCNWGEALTKSMIEKAELLRAAIQNRALMDAKIKQHGRLLTHIEETRDGVITNTEIVMADVTEQTYDIRMDLNEALVVFCQAYFYENMYECRDSYKPKFGGSLTDLLIKINDASMDDLLIGSAPSTVERELVIKDEDDDCIDPHLCPITNLKDTRMLVFNLPTSHKELLDLDAYKVAELKLNFTGVKTKDPKNPWLKVKIESSGEFKGRANKNVYNFLTRPTSVSFEYNIITNHISIYANVDAAFRNIVQHVTPYTTWVMRVSPSRSADIDFSDVTSVAVRFRGSAVDNETFKKRLQMAHPELVQDM